MSEPVKPNKAVRQAVARMFSEDRDAPTSERVLEFAAICKKEESNPDSGVSDCFAAGYSLFFVMQRRKGSQPANTSASWDLLSAEERQVWIDQAGH